MSGIKQVKMERCIHLRNKHSLPIRGLWVPTTEIVNVKIPHELQIQLRTKARLICGIVAPYSIIKFFKTLFLLK